MIDDQLVTFKQISLAMYIGLMLELIHETLPESDSTVITPSITTEECGVVMVTGLVRFRGGTMYINDTVVLLTAIACQKISRLK